MDPNANANVQGVPQTDPSAGAPADANVTNPSPAPADDANERTQPTDPKAGESGGFDPDVQKFLNNQNIKTDDLKAAVTELAKRNMKLRGGAQPNQTNQEVADLLNPKSGPTTEPKKEPTPAPKSESKQTPQPHSLSDLDIANVSMFVKQQYPDVTTNKQFYESMIADGFRPTTADGQIDLKHVMSYAAYRQKLADAEKTIAANQPQANQIPQPSNAPEYADVTPVQTMDETAAQNIIMFSNQQKRYGQPIHPQYNEAVKFLQDQTRKMK